MSAARSTLQRATRAVAAQPIASSSAPARAFATAASCHGLRHQRAPAAASPLSRFTAPLSYRPLKRGFHTSQPRSMFIQTESTPNEDSLKFLPGQQVMNSGTAEFLDSRDSMRSPLAKTLFGLDGVRSVFFGPDFVTVSKVTDTNWGTLKPEIYSTLMEHFTAGHPLFAEEGDHGSSDTTILDTDSETVAMIKELLDTRVRPAIQEDGGDLEFRGFGEDSDGLVRVKLKGSCRGCDSSTVTLKSGIERMLMHYIPEVKGVEQVLDVEEEIALDEFSKLEQKLNRDKESERKRESSMGFSV